MVRGSNPVRASKDSRDFPLLAQSLFDFHMLETEMLHSFTFELQKHYYVCVYQGHSLIG